MECSEEEIEDACPACDEPLGSSVKPGTRERVSCCVNPDCDLFDIEVTDGVDPDYCCCDAEAPQ